MAAEQPDLVVVEITNGVRTSAGSGPGVFSLPRPEAASLIERRLARPGAEPTPQVRSGRSN